QEGLNAESRKPTACSECNLQLSIDNLQFAILEQPVSNTHRRLKHGNTDIHGRRTWGNKRRVVILHPSDFILPLVGLQKCGASRTGKEKCRTGNQGTDAYGEVSVSLCLCGEPRNPREYDAQQ